ncbi:hypothetical protein EH243_06310 [Amphritea opalescens]|uniref:Sarcosine oxidase subunit gamma n=1 Tax=Amphritea opalescens TaxID=2490544 RepID=A0A430KT82_9GAMM|nr:sarcosine oxidase subunit gamma family protein [Amphritea opalescens]RTE66690.1 hypothetical protein EH243_06310 [Amphritea opalescens]
MDKLALQTTLNSTSLGHEEVNISGIRINPVSSFGMVRLQGPGNDRVFKEFVGTEIVNLPGPSETAVTNELRCLWLTPNEWLFVTTEGQEVEVLKKLQPITVGRAALATMITDSRAVYAISGDKVEQLLSKICTLNLELTSFPIDHCVITRMVGIAVMIVRLEESMFEFYVDRSQATFFWERLKDAALEL